MQKLADETALTLHVHHYPPGTSKWNKIEHRLFCRITQNWRGRPVTDRVAVVKLIGATTTRAGLTIDCVLDQRTYEKGIKVSEAGMDTLDIVGDAFHPEWNYTSSQGTLKSSSCRRRCPKDGWVAIGCPHDDFWKLLVKSIGCTGLADDTRYLTTADRIARRADVEGLVSGWTGTRIKAEISAVLGGKIPFGPVLRIDEIFADPHARARQMLAEVELPSTEPDQRLALAGTAVKMTGTPGGVRHRAPLTGEHTAKILAEFGYGEADIAALEAKGAVVRR